MSQTQTWAEQVSAATRQVHTRQVGAIPVFYPILTGLGVRELVNTHCRRRTSIDLGRIVKILTLNRLLAPQPLYHVGRWVEQTIVGQMLGVRGSQVYDSRLGRALDALFPELETLWTQLTVRAVRQEQADLSVIHWDTTTFYFEGAYVQSDLARYGHSSDGKTECKRAKIGYDVTHLARLPFVYRLLSGNAADITLPVENLERIWRFLFQADLDPAVVRPLIVSDGKMVTPALVAAAHQREVFYLGPWEANDAVRKTLREVSAEELATHPLPYRPKRQAKAEDWIPYQAVWRPFTITHEGQHFTDHGLVVWSANKQRLDEQKRKHHLKALLNRLREIQRHLNQGRYIRHDYAAHQIKLAQRGNPARQLVDVELRGQDRALSLYFAINRTKLAEVTALDGRYLLGTNHPQLTATQALTYFKGQDGIEKRNSLLKGPLQIRPIYLQNDQRIAGLVFLTMVALLIWSILELRCQRAGLRYPGQRIVDEFAPLYVSDLTFVDDSRLSQIGDVSTFQQAVLDGLHFPPVDSYLTILPPDG